MVYFDKTTKQIFDILNLEYPISENNKTTYYLIDETKWKSKKNKIINFCEAMFLLEQCKNSKDSDKITKEIEKIKQKNLKQIKNNDDDELELFLLDFAEMDFGITERFI